MVIYKKLRSARRQWTPETLWKHQCRHFSEPFPEKMKLRLFGYLPASKLPSTKVESAMGIGIVSSIRQKDKCTQDINWIVLWTGVTSMWHPLLAKRKNTQYRSLDWTQQIAKSSSQVNLPLDDIIISANIKLTWPYENANEGIFLGRVSRQWNCAYINTFSFLTDSPSKSTLLPLMISDAISRLLHLWSQEIQRKSHGVKRDGKKQPRRYRIPKPSTLSFTIAKSLSHPHWRTRASLRKRQWRHFSSESSVLERTSEMRLFWLLIHSLILIENEVKFWEPTPSNIRFVRMNMFHLHHRTCEAKSISWRNLSMNIPWIEPLHLQTAQVAREWRYETANEEIFQCP